MRSLRDTTVENIRRLRKSRGMTQHDLAVRLNLLGGHVDRTAVAKVENRKRELTLEEAFRYAWALDVAPVHLFLPADSNEPIEIGPNMECSPAEARAWIRGQMPLFQDARVYYSAVPESEFAATRQALAEWQQAAPITVVTEEEEESP